MLGGWPASREEVLDEDAERQFAVLQDLVTEVNRFRSQNNVPRAARFELTVTSRSADLLERHAKLVSSLAGLSGLRLVGELEDMPGASTIVFGGGQAQVELAGLIDVAGELQRLEKELERAEVALARVDGKLANASFVERAPADVVERERAKRDELADTIARRRERLEALRRLEG
jgi:valyl-tRNA synthetase